MSTSRIEPSRIFTHITLAFGGSLLVLAGLFYAASHAGHDISPARLIEVIRAGSSSFLVLYAVMSLLGLFVRTWRYRVLLRASGEENIPGIKDMTLITAVRNMTVDLLPARLGELVFVALLRRNAGTRVSSSLSTLLFATLLDILILAPITIAIGLMVGFPNKQPYMLALIALFVVVAFLIGIKYILPYFSRLIDQLAGHSNRFVGGFFRFIRSIDQAVEATMAAGVFGSVISLTLAVRFFKYAALLALFYGLTKTSFPAIWEMGELKVLAAMIASEMTASMPVPALMSFGTWELGGMTLLAYFGAAPQDALITLLGVHIQTQALDYGIGIVAFLALFMLGKEVHTRAGKTYRRRAGIGIVFVVIAAILTWFSLKSTPEQIPKVSGIETEVTRPTSEPLPAWAAELNGHIVWSSNRSGNHDIWLMRLPEMKIRRLTTNKHTENFARISPDGKKVVFARSHKEWQSLRDEKPWDIWMIDIESGREQLIAKWGMAPSWSADGSFITFQRNPGAIMAYDLAKAKERVLYESGKDDFIRHQTALSTPSVGNGKQLAFTYRNKGQPTNIIRDKKGKFTVVHRDSCQVMWAPSGDFVTYVQKGGHQTNQIMRYDPISKKKTRLLDLPGDYSHEYFARLTADERYLVFAASGGGHEHDLADYELFLWPVGAKAKDATRLTFNKGNDSWPDIWLKSE